MVNESTFASLDRSRTRILGILVVVTVLGAACGGSDDDAGVDSVPDSSVAVAVVDSSVDSIADSTDSTSGAEQLFPDVVDATARLENLGWTFDVTISSPYDTASRYADAWRIIGPDGTIYGVRELAHDHAAEQPFTRSLNSVEIPEDVDVVTLEGRDQDNGWGGGTFELTLSRS